MSFSLGISLMWIGPCSCKIASGLKNAKRNSLVEVLHAPKEQRVPFLMVGNRIMITVKVGDKGAKANLFVDDGAITMISSGFIKKNAIPISDSDAVKIYTATAGGTDWKMYTAKDIPFEINGIKVLKKYLTVTDLGKANAALKESDGLIGVDILSKFNLAIDFEKNELIFYDQHTMPANLASYETQLPFETYSGHKKTPEVTLTVQGDEQHFVWDMGYNGGFLNQFHKEKDMQQWIQDHPGALKYESDGALRDAKGISLKTTNYYILSDTIYCNGKQIPINPIYMSYSFNPKLSWENHSNLGIGFMKNYKVFIDWKNEKIYLHHLHLSNKAPDFPNIFTVYNASEKELRVVSINTKSIAYQNGLGAGDVLTGINGKKLDDITYPSGTQTDSIIKEEIKKASDVTVQGKGTILIAQ